MRLDWILKRFNWLLKCLCRRYPPGILSTAISLVASSNLRTDLILKDFESKIMMFVPSLMRISCWLEWIIASRSWSFRLNIFESWKFLSFHFLRFDLIFFLFGSSFRKEFEVSANFSILKLKKCWAYTDIWMDMDDQMSFLEYIF